MPARFGGHSPPWGETRDRCRGWLARGRLNAGRGRSVRRLLRFSHEKNCTSSPTESQINGTSIIIVGLTSDSCAGRKSARAPGGGKAAGCMGVTCPPCNGTTPGERIWWCQNQRRAGHSRGPPWHRGSEGSGRRGSGRGSSSGRGRNPKPVRSRVDRTSSRPP